MDTVIQVTSDFIFVDVGYKSEGKIPVIEFGDIPPKVGDVVSVILVKKEDPLRRDRRLEEASGREDLLAHRL